MVEELQRPYCNVCKRVVDAYSDGKNFRTGSCFFESRCHGQIDRFEYWPATAEAATFVPTSAFPSEHPPADQLHDKPMIEPSVASVADELGNMPAWQRLARLSQCEMSFRLLRRNAGELEQLLAFLTEDPRSMELIGPRGRTEFDQHIEELLFRLHNFVASAQSLVDHTRALYRELHQPDNLFPDYDDEVKRRFAQKPLVQFVQKLRQLAQHVRLPQVSYRLSARQDSDVTRRILLSKGDLLGFDGWNSASKKYLEGAPDDIDLAMVVEHYVREIVDFQSWLTMRWNEIHSSDQARVSAKRAEGISLLAKDIPHHLEAGLASYLQGPGDFKDIFSFGLATSDWNMLVEFDGDLQDWVHRAIDLLEQRFGKLPLELVARIKRQAIDASL